MMAMRPVVKEGIGMKPQFQELKMELKSHQSGEFTTDENVFDIRLHSPNNLKTTFKLQWYGSGGEEKEMPNDVFTQTEDNEIVFHMALPYVGWYIFNIFAMIEGNTGSLPCVYTYLIELTKLTENTFPFPKQYSDVCKGWYLHEPLFLDSTKAPKKVDFKVTVPNAKRVAVKVQDEWTDLDKKRKDVWEGNVYLERYWNKGVDVNVNAFIGSDETPYTTILQYKV